MLSDEVNRALNGANGADQQAIAERGLAVVELLLRKNHDYGSSAFESPVLAPSMSPLDAIQCRMSDKISRIAGIAGGRNSKVPESLSDSMADLAGYAVLWLVYAQRLNEMNSET